MTSWYPGALASTVHHRLASLDEHRSLRMATHGNAVNEFQAALRTIANDWQASPSEELRIRSSRRKLKSNTAKLITKMPKKTPMATRKHQRAPAGVEDELKAAAEGLSQGRSEGAAGESRTVQDYVRAVYFCTVYEGEEEYAAVSPAYPSGVSSSCDSADEAIDDLRMRIETDIREIIEEGRDWWARQGDRKLVPLPSELPGTPDGEFEHFLRETGFGLRRKYVTTLTVFPGGA